MLVIVVVVVIVVMVVAVQLVAVLARHDESRVGRGDPALDDALRCERPAAGDDRAQRGFERVAVGARIEKRRQQHVAGSAADHVDVAGSHRATILCASAAAPKPLSMFTTPIPGAQAVSIPSSAASPSNAAP